MNTIATAAIVVLVVATAEPPPQQTFPLPHAAEVKLFVSTMAIAQVASDRCADILVNFPLLADLQKRMHVAKSDDEAIRVEGRSALDIINKAASTAPSMKMWCDTVYRLYGPDGGMVRSLLSR